MKSFLTKNFVLILIIIVAVFTRFWDLGKNPPELYVDEVSNGYNAYSIAKTGRDEYGNFLPLTFRAFGDYNLPLSVYLLVPSIAVFGLSAFAVRFPSALLGTLTVLLTYLLTKKLFEDDGQLTAIKKRSANLDIEVVSQNPPRSRLHQCHILGENNQRLTNWLRHVFDWRQASRKPAASNLLSETIALLAMFLLAVSPWHLQFSRYDHEANFMVFFVVLGITLFLYSSHNFRLLTLSAIAFGLGLNTYHGAKVWIPAILLTLIILYLKQLRIWKLKLILPAVIILVSAIPNLSNLSQGSIRAQSVGIFGKGESPLNLFISGYLSHFSPNFLFIAGDTIGRHSVSGMGQLYVFELPLILAGILALIQKKTPHKKLLLSWLLLAPIPAALATPTPHALRSLTFLPLWSIIASLGLVTLLKSISNIKFKTTLFIGLFLLAAYNVITYFHLYYKHYPKLKAADWNGGYQEMVEYVAKIKNNYEVVAISNFYGHPYIFILFYSKYDPALYHPQSQDKSKFDKYEFFGASWEKKTPGTALLVRPHWQKPDPPPKYIKEIYDSANTLVFRISEE